MNISLNILWSNSYQYVKSKISDGLSPMEKKVAMIAIAYFSLAALGYFVYRFMWRTSAERVSYLNENPQVRVTNRKIESKDKTPRATMEIVEVQDSGDPLSAAQIAIQNADQLRSILDSDEIETLNPNGQERTLYLDERGQLQGMGSQSDSPMWLNEKQAFAYEIKIRMHKHQWEPSQQPAFEWNARLQWGKSLPDPIVAIVDATLQELNQLASGSFQMAKKQFPNDPSDDARWLTIFSNPDVHSSAALLIEADASEEASKKTPVDILPIPNHKPQEDEEDDLYNDVVEDLPKKAPVDALPTPNHKSQVDEDDYLDNDVLEDLPKKTPVGALPTPIQPQLMDPFPYDKDDDLYLNDDKLAFKVLPQKIGNCALLTDKALDHLKEMRLAAVNFSGCAKLTDQAFDHLKGILAHVDLGASDNLSD